VSRREVGGVVSDEMAGEPSSKKGASRRAALKAGVGVGVGVLAWSGPTITSLGGTPAYAQGCTFVQLFRLAECRNTTGSAACSGLAYGMQALDVPQGFTVTYDGDATNFCCGQLTATVGWTASVECKAFYVLFDGNPCGVGNILDVLTFPASGGGSSSPLAIPLSCLVFNNPNDRWGLALRCNTVGAPPDCLANPA
jgi:hypothetical protein